jgi:hypothetical protein
MPMRPVVEAQIVLKAASFDYGFLTVLHRACLAKRSGA